MTLVPVLAPPTMLLSTVRRAPVLHDKSGDFDTPVPVNGKAAPQKVPDAATAEREELQRGAPSTGRVIVFMHISGGAGATTLAVNTACTLNEGKRACCLIDLDLQFGSVASLLDVQRSSALQALIDEPGRLERIAFDQMLASHSSGLQVLTAPRVPLPLDALKTSTVSDLLDAARARFRFVVVDLPVALGPWTDIVLSKATQIYLVTPLTVPAAHNIARFFFLLAQHDLHLPISIVVNRDVKLAKDSLIAPNDFKTAIGRSIDHIVPEDFPLVQQSHNQGTPAVILAPKSVFARAIGEIAGGETGVPAVVKPQRSFFRL